MPEPEEPACCGACGHAATVGDSDRSVPPSPPLRPEGWSLVIVHGAESRAIALAHGRRTIGRGAQNDVVIQDSSLSRVTCALVVGDEGVFVEDQQSSCGTYVNGKKVLRSGLHENDVIRVGNSTVGFRRA